jgi:hypothetical protein
MTAARSSHTASVLSNGMVLLAGGFAGGSNGYLASAELYNPATGTFTPTGSMATPRYFHTSTTMGAFVAITGGENSSGDLNSVEVYNTSTGTFASAGILNSPREGHTAIMCSTGLLIIGGYNNNAPLPTAELAPSQSSAGD